MRDKNNKREIYPEHYYDKDGVLKPSKIYYFIIAYLLRGYVVITIASAYGSDTNGILKVFYTSSEALYAGMLVGLPGLIAWGLLSYRIQIRERNRERVFKIIRPLLVSGLIIDGVILVRMLNLIKWQFDFALACNMLIYIIITMLVIKLYNQKSELS